MKKFGQELKLQLRPKYFDPFSQCSPTERKKEGKNKTKKSPQLPHFPSHVPSSPLSYWLALPTQSENPSPIFIFFILSRSNTSLHQTPSSPLPNNGLSGWSESLEDPVTGSIVLAEFDRRDPRLTQICSGKMGSDIRGAITRFCGSGSFDRVEQFHV